MRRVLITLGLVLALGGCQADRQPVGSGPDKKDGSGPPDKSLWIDGQPPDWHKPLPRPGWDYVVNGLHLPTTALEAKNYGLEYKGKRYNALGNIVSLLAAQMPGFTGKQGVLAQVQSGQLLMLLRLYATSLVNDPGANARLYNGATRKCCDNPSNHSQCASQSRSRCFNGSTSFQIQAKAPTNVLASGDISGGALRLGPATLMLRFPFGVGGSQLLTFKHGAILGQVSSKGIFNGRLVGAIPEAEVRSTLMPVMAKLLDQFLKDPNTDAQTRKMLRQLFDANGDGTISASELINNALIKTFLGGDLDVDGDGKRELSVGFGLSAVRCKISN